MNNPPLVIIHVQKASQPISRVITLPDNFIKTMSGAVLTLYAIIVQTGTASYGHYTTYLKCDDGWYFFNDSAVRPIIEYLTEGDLNQLPQYQSICRDAVDFIYMSK